MVEFESLKENEREKVKTKPEYKEIEKYYKDYHDVLHHNVSIHYWRQSLGLEPEGKVEWYSGNMISLLRKKIPKEEQWELGPDRIHHSPKCEYRLSGYTDSLACYCGFRRQKSIMAKLKKIK